ncbi:hypothetical protein [Nocardioides sp. CER19]|uniref:hypothetical protein n=1 Tax=Nocardioides sp. CER19 TaxID=3038538 RepID=UPI002448B3A9|nr:hypothetical protein [Nocardioides sp. CER19]MDH2412783.1 hypothetical protein [Nocardioides sp. CER19]
MTRQTTLLERATDRTTDAVEIAVEAAQEFIENTAKPFVENTAKPAIQGAAAKTAPIVAAGAGIAAERATQAKQFAEAKSQELTGHPKKKRKGRKLLMFALLGGLLGAAAVLARKFMGDSGEWTSAGPASTPDSPGETLYTDEPVDDLTTPVNKPPYSPS